MVTVGQHVYNSLVLIAYNYFSANVPSSLITNVHPEEGLGIREQIINHGYSFMEHQVQTDDGYLLTLFRLSSPNLDNSTKDGNNNKEWGQRPKAPVLFVHGLLSSAQDWVVLGPNVSIAYGLVDKGYDVWLGNCRGNRWSRKHIKYNPEENRFWKFSFHEIGYYDLPAKLDYISGVTGFESIYYIGHSQGTTAMLVMASERPEFIKKVRLFTALAPVAYPKNVPSIFATFCAMFYKQLEWMIQTFELPEIFPHSKLLTDTFALISRRDTPFVSLFRSLLFTNMGYSDDTDENIYPLIMNSFPAGSSSRQLLHFTQNMVSDTFRKYDHGPITNLQMYGQWQPPKYNVRTKLPTALIYSINDWLSTKDDVDRISADLKNLKLKYLLPGAFGHMDYLFGRQTTKICLNVILSLFKEN